MMPQVNPFSAPRLIPEPAFKVTGADNPVRIILPLMKSGPADSRHQYSVKANDFILF